MGIENESGGICSIHNCPTYACPNDCPNNLVVKPDSAEVSKYARMEESKESKEKLLSKAEIIEKIAGLAALEGFVPEDLQPEAGQESRDSEGNVQYFSMEVKPGAAPEKKADKITFEYRVKSKYNPATSITRSESYRAKPDEVAMSEVVLEYDAVSKKWFKP